jgi:hypothetical protein
MWHSTSPAAGLGYEPRPSGEVGVSLGFIAMNCTAALLLHRCRPKRPVVPYAIQPRNS